MLNCKSSWFNTLCMVVVLLAFIAGCAVADEVTSGRELSSKMGGAVVKIQLVIKTTSSYGGDSSSDENKAEVTGTMLDPSGLTVTSLTSTDPESMFSSGDEEFKSVSEVTDVKIILSDGQEIPAKIVLRDKDLDLAFIRPVKKLTTPMTCVDLKDSSKAQIFDPCIILSRLGKVGNRTLSVCLERVQAVIEKPRRFYTVSLSSMADEFGSPAFGVDGKPIGIVVYRQMPKTSSSSMYDDDSVPVILPADDIAPVAAQAPEDAPKEETKPAETKAEK